MPQHPDHSAKRIASMRGRCQPIATPTPAVSGLILATPADCSVAQTMRSIPPA